MKLTMLTMEGCSHCTQAKTIIEQVQPDYPELEVEYKLIAENPELAAKYGVMSAPGIIIEDKLEFTGGLDEVELRVKLDEYKKTS